MNTDFSDSNKKPLFSIIIPTLNEEQYIEQCLNSIFSSDYDLAKYEVIVVDNGSTDKTCAIVSKFQDVSLHKLPSARVGAVRNEGARYAHGNYLIFIDGDCLIDKAWLSRAEELCINNSAFVFGGAAKLPDAATWIEKHWLLEKDGAPTLPKHLIGASIVIKKNAFDELNGFDEDLSSGEDTDLHSRLIESRFTIKILSDLNVVHLGNAKTIPAFFKRQLWHSETYASNYYKSLSDPMFILVITWLALLVASVLGLFIFESSLTILAIWLGLFTLPLLLTQKRLKRAKIKSFNLRFILKMYILDLIYLAARCLGVILGIMSSLKNTILA